MSSVVQAQVNQLVQIQPWESQADTLEETLTLTGAILYLKLGESMNQAVTQVNDVSPVMYIIVKVDAFHKCGRQNQSKRHWPFCFGFTGILDDSMIQDGLFVNTRGLQGWERRPYDKSRTNAQDLSNDHAVVGLDDSTRSKLRACTWGSVQQSFNFLNTSFPDTQRSAI